MMQQQTGAHLTHKVDQPMVLLLQAVKGNLNSSFSVCDAAQHFLNAA